MRLNNKDKELICECIKEDIEAKNNKIKSAEDLDKECERNVLKDFQTLITIITEKSLVIKKLQKDFQDACDRVKAKIENKEDFTGLYFKSYNSARDEILVHLKKTKIQEYDKLYKKYNMIPIPSARSIEKMLLKSESNCVPTLIKEITNIIEKKNEYTEIRK
tara:strand:+ start:3532 stop:4017 length:486 start_codon:yes stop_codon:yes gene_type:complete